MPRNRWPRSLFRRRCKKFELERGTRRKRDGDTVWDFSSPEEICGFIRPFQLSDADDYTIKGSGEQTQILYLFDVLERGERSSDTAISSEYIVEPPIESGDRIRTDSGPYRVVDPNYEHHTGVGRYALIEDNRGDEAGDEPSNDEPYQIA